MTIASTEMLIQDLRVVASEFSHTLTEEGSAIRAAKFAQAIGMQDRKINLHHRLFSTLEHLKSAPKSDAQKEELRILVTLMSVKAQENKKSIELGFSALERLTGKILGVMRKAIQKETPSYTASGTYHRNRSQSATLQTDRTA